MRLHMTPGVQSWIKSLPPGGTISVRRKTADELREERAHQIEKHQNRNREVGG